MAVGARPTTSTRPVSLRRLPAPTAIVLGLVILAFVLRSLAFVGLLPAWQGPDEQSHYAYVANVAHGDLVPGDLATFATTPALDASVLGSGYLAFRNRTADRPFTPAQRALLPGEAPDLPDDPIAAVGYPPLYYAVLAPAYRVPGLDTATARLFALRVGSVLIGAVLIPLTFLLLREFVDDRLALLGTAIASLPPMLVQAAAIVNPDILLTVTCAGLTLACVRVHTRGPSWPRLVAVVAWAVAASQTKPVGLPAALTLAAGLLVVPAVLRRSRRPLAALAVVVGVGLAGLTVLAAIGAPSLRSASGLRFAASYVWQFYLPPLPFMTDVFVPGAPSDPIGILSDPLPAWAVWVRTGVGYFGWVSARLHPALYGLAAAGAAAVALAGVVVGWRRMLPGAAGRVLVACVVSLLGFLLVLHVADADFRLTYNDRLLQGRYLLPFLPLGALLTVLIAVSFGTRRATAGLLALGAVWLAVSIGSYDALLGFYGR